MIRNIRTVHFISRRLCPEISFFQQPTNYPSSYVSSKGKSATLSQRVSKCLLETEVLTRTRTGGTNLSKKLAREEYQSLVPASQEAHWEVVQRILFIYYKLNPGVKYVQGMNELMGPIYYVFACDPDVSWKSEAEADAFFCFQNLMSEVKDNFISNLDNSNCGIEQAMAGFYQMFARLEPTLYQQLAVDQELLPQYYAFRWLSLLLSQEFFLPDVIRIWDSLFADSSRFDFLLYVCLAMLVHLQSDLLENDFTANMKLLQNYPPVDIGDILVLACHLRERDQKQKNSS